jgi:hypothetical protein
VQRAPTGETKRNLQFRRFVDDDQENALGLGLTGRHGNVSRGLAIF